MSPHWPIIVINQSKPIIFLLWPIISCAYLQGQLTQFFGVQMKCIPL
jgi:hypothetical protein